MPDEAGRDAAFYDHENEPRRHVADWGGDELFTRMPRRREVHAAPAPRFRRPAPIDPIHRPTAGEPTGRFRRDEPADERRGAAPPDDPDRVHGHGSGRGRRAPDAGGRDGAGESRRTDALDLYGAELYGADLDPGAAPAPGDAAPPAHQPAGRRTVVIAGRPDGVARPLRQHRRPPRTVAERIGPRPERIVAWAFVLGLLLILIAIATADAATL